MKKLSAGHLITTPQSLALENNFSPPVENHLHPHSGIVGAQGLFTILLATSTILFVFLTTLAAQQPGSGLSKDQVLKLLQQDPLPRVQYLVNKYGISFAMTPDTEKELTQAGATVDLLATLRKLSPEPPKPAPPPPTELVIHAQPGDAEVYLDDERVGQTSSEGALKLSGMQSGSRRLRLSRTGYHSFEMTVELTAGKTNTVAATLQPIEAPPKAPPPDSEPEHGGSAASSSASPDVPEHKAPANPNDPLAPHEAGIYLFDQNGGSHLTQLDPAPYSGPQPSIGRSAAFGAGWGKMKWKSVIYGSKARVRLSDKHSIFYFYFATPGGNTLSVAPYAFQNASSPNAFVLVHLESRKNERDIPGSGGSSSAVPPKDLVAFDYEKVASGIYKVQPKADFVPGEYGFLYGGVLSAMGGSGLFDFGVDGKK